MMPVVSGPNPPHKNYQEKKIGRVREKTMHTFKTLIQHWGWIPRNASLGLVTAPPWKLIKKIFKKSYKSLHFNVGIARSKWKIEQQAGKAESSYFKQWFEESISYLPHLHIPSTPSYAAGVNLFVPLLTAARGGNQRCSYARMEQILLADASFAVLCCTWKSRRWVSALLLCCSLMGSALSPHIPVWFFGNTAPFSVMSIKRDAPHSWTLLLWTLVRSFSPQVSSKSEVKHVKTI